MLQTSWCSFPDCKIDPPHVIEDIRDRFVDLIILNNVMLLSNEKIHLAWIFLKGNGFQASKFQFKSNRELIKAIPQFSSTVSMMQLRIVHSLCFSHFILNTRRTCPLFAALTNHPGGFTARFVGV